MTKTIEYIEKEIENSKKLLDRAIHYNLTICVKNETEKLQILEQIKCELEAWEEVKKDKGICEKQEFRGKDCKKIIQISCKIFPEGTEQNEKLKKALEVKDEYL